MKKITAERLLDAYYAAVEISDMVADLSFQEYRSERKTQLATQFLFTVIGEALSKAAIEEPDVVASIDGASDAIGMRHRIVHGYNQVDHMTVWATAIDDLPDLRAELREALIESDSWPS